jgi:hypothetical protein
MVNYIFGMAYGHAMKLRDINVCWMVNVYEI